MNDQQRAEYVLARLQNRRYESSHEERVVPILDEFAAVRAEERAACLALVEELHDLYGKGPGRYVAHQISERIRARGRA